MSSVIEAKVEETTNIQKVGETALKVFLRLLSIAFIFLTIKTWLTAVGYWGEGNLRFDTMSNPWRTYISVLAVLQPVVAVGLWTTQSWGRIMWFAAAAIQILAITTFSDTFGSDPFQLLFHLICLGIYISIQLWLRFSAKKE